MAIYGEKSITGKAYRYALEYENRYWNGDVQSIRLPNTDNYYLIVQAQRRIDSERQTLNEFLHNEFGDTSAFPADTTYLNEYNHKPSTYIEEGHGGICIDGLFVREPLGKDIMYNTNSVSVAVLGLVSACVDSQPGNSKNIYWFDIQRLSTCIAITEWVWELRNGVSRETLIDLSVLRYPVLDMPLSFIAQLDKERTRSNVKKGDRTYRL